MAIIAMQLYKVEGHRSDIPVKGEIKINSAPKLTSVDEMTIPSMEKKVLSVGFDFVSEYEPAVGKILLSGKVLLTHPEVSDVVASFKKNKLVPEDVSVEVLNHLFRTCLIRISQLTEELNLPLPISIPQVDKKAQAKK